LLHHIYPEPPMKKLLIAAAALFAATGLARADVTLGGQTWNTSSATTITLSNIVPPGNQVKNLPCIICGDNQPLQPSNFGYNDFGNTGNQTDLKFFSSGTIDDKTLGSDTLSATNYSAGFLINFLQAAGDANLTFSIGLDVNDTNVAQTLASFYFLDVTTHTVLSAFTTDTLVPDQNNGTGFPDYTLNGLTLQGVNSGDQLAFFARITGANDGPDSFFLEVQAAPAVPEASTWAMMILGFAGVGLLALRRRREGHDFRFA
jgi:hypothetical protein